MYNRPYKYTEKTDQKTKAITDNETAEQKKQNEERGQYIANVLMIETKTLELHKDVSSKRIDPQNPNNL